MLLQDDAAVTTLIHMHEDMVLERCLTPTYSNHEVHGAPVSGCHGSVSESVRRHTPARESHVAPTLGESPEGIQS